MNPTEQMKRQQQYKTYVDQKTPRHNLWLNMLRAFLTGGAVCVLGQCFVNSALSTFMDAGGNPVSSAFYAFSEARYCSVSSTAFAIHWEHGTSGVPVATPFNSRQ